MCFNLLSGDKNSHFVRPKSTYRLLPVWSPITFLYMRLGFQLTFSTLFIVSTLHLIFKCLRQQQHRETRVILPPHVQAGGRKLKSGNTCSVVCNSHEFGSKFQHCYICASGWKPLSSDNLTKMEMRKFACCDKLFSLGALLLTLRVHLCAIRL